MKQRLPLRTAFVWILASVFLVSGSATGMWYYSQVILAQRRLDPAFDISILVQTGPEREPLKSACLAELLDLSVDAPTSIYAFNVETAKEKLLACPVIMDALVRTYSPNTVYIDYTTRKPIAYIGDYSNTAVDASGVLFPSEPYYTPKKLPELYLGLSPSTATADIWGRPVSVKSFSTAMALLDAATRILGTDETRIVKIDVSKAYAGSYGQRQVILIIEEVFDGPVLCYMPRTLRLSTIHYAQALRDYASLRNHLRQQIKPPANQSVYRAPMTVVDLRLPNLAYLGV